MWVRLGALIEDEIVTTEIDAARVLSTARGLDGNLVVLEALVSRPSSASGVELAT